MKASAFSYARPTTVPNALELLALHGDRAKVLAGGQSLMPAMNLRLISPKLIVDIGAIVELRGISLKGEVLLVGALTRHVDLHNSAEIARYAPLLKEAIAHVAHPAIRNRGTIGGSLAHADPAAELPACMMALGATLLVRGVHGERRIAAEEFFTGIYETLLSPDELLIAVEIPVAQRNSSPFFQEFSRRRGDYAIVGLAAQAVLKNSGFSDLRLAFFSVGNRPHLAKAARQLTNVVVTRSILSDASDLLRQELDPHEDQHATPAMRRYLANLLLRRCVSKLLDRPDLLEEP